MDKAFSKWWHGFQYLLWDSDIPALQKEMKMHSENHAAFKLLAKPKASASNNWAMKHNTGTFCHRWRGVQDQAQSKHMCLKIPSVSGSEQVTSHRIAVRDWLHWGVYGRQFNTSDMSQAQLSWEDGRRRDSERAVLLCHNWKENLCIFPVLFRKDLDWAFFLFRRFG